MDSRPGLTNVGAVFEDAGMEVRWVPQGRFGMSDFLACLLYNRVLEFDLDQILVFQDSVLKVPDRKPR